MEGELWKFESGHAPTYEDMVKYKHHNQTILVNSPHFNLPTEATVVDISKDGSLVKLVVGLWGGCWVPICELSVIQLMTNPEHIKCKCKCTGKAKPCIFNDAYIQAAYEQIVGLPPQIEEEDNEDEQ